MFEIETYGNVYGNQFVNRFTDIEAQKSRHEISQVYTTGAAGYHSYRSLIIYPIDELSD